MQTRHTDRLYSLYELCTRAYNDFNKLIGLNRKWKMWFSLALFVNFEAKHAEKALKTKNCFCKCVLDFNFVSIKGSGLFTFSKKARIFEP